MFCERLSVNRLIIEQPNAEYNYAQNLSHQR